MLQKEIKKIANRITQTARYRQSLIQFAQKHGVTKAAVRYHTNRQYIYRWIKRYDGTLHSLEDRSHRPHRHPNQHTPEEIKPILNMRHRNPNAGIVVFWVKLHSRGYTRSISGFYRFLRKRNSMAVKLPNPKKYTPKPYEQMSYPGQRVQFDVKVVPKICIVGQEEPTQWYQYTFIDEYTRFRYLEAFPERSTYSSALFIQHCVQRFPYAIECVQTDNGSMTYRAESGAKPTTDEMDRINEAIRRADHYGYNLRTVSHRYFIVEKFYPMDFRKSSKNPIQKSKFFNLADMFGYKTMPDTDVIANDLNGRTWEEF